MKSVKKSCLIVSYGPVPTPKYQKIEGGGMRCWGLAQGLATKGYDVTVGVHKDFPLDTSKSEGIHLVNWSEDEEFAGRINAYDIVVMNYSMGGPMSFVIDHIADHVTLVLDCYVPIYIEVSARDSDDKATEYSNYSHDILHYNKALKRGDYFLCANVPQKHMYMGALSALGIINPYSYKNERVLLVPFGVESKLSIKKARNPYKELGINESDFTLLWFGGLYPWFNIKPLLKAIDALAAKYKNFKFVIVGGKNPYNNHPDFVKQYETTYEHFSKSGLLDTSVFFVDWVDFSDRINWYQNASTVISINNDGDENIYSWRTRVMDYVWGEIPMITNGGDPLSDSLVDAGAAIKLPALDEKTLQKTIEELMKNRDTLENIRQALLRQKESYYWERVVEPIDKVLKSGQQPYLDEKIFIEEFRPDTITDLETSGLKRKLKKLARAPRKVVRIVKQKGVKRTVSLIIRTATNRLQKTIRRSERHYFFFSHPLDYTGAPKVLVDIVHDFAPNVGKRNVSVVYPGGEKLLLRTLFKLGVLMDKMVMGVGDRIIHAQLGIQKHDFVLLNTVAIYPNYRDYVLGLLETNRLEKAIWFIHEDQPEIRFDDKGLVARVKRLIASGHIQIVVPSVETAEDYNKFFDTDSAKSVTLRVDIPDEFTTPRTEDAYDKLKFVISGTPSDGRKGQLLAIAAFSKFLNEIASKNNKLYRDFELDLISIGDDYISKQIKSIGTGLLGERVRYYPQVSRDEALRLTSDCNVTICSSLNETFGLFVAEGMLMGHVILRNNASGLKSQLSDKKNGYLVNTNDLDDFSDKIALLLDRKRSSNKQLKAMGIASQKIAKKFETSDYYKQLES